jgi:peptidoglycan hydrolase-like protein with peptidoglycan-binding domain
MDHRESNVTRSTAVLTVLTTALLAATAAGASGAGRADALSVEAINAAEFPAKTVGGVNPATLKAQVLLDRARFSPGVIDGRGGENVEKAIRAFEEANDFKADGKMDEEPGPSSRRPPTSRSWPSTPSRRRT